MNSNVETLRYAKAAHAKLEHERSSGGDHPHQRGGHYDVNVGEVERQISLVSGTVLAVCGLLKGSLSGLGLAAIGRGLIWRGHTGHCEVYHALGHSSVDCKAGNQCGHG